MGGGGATTPAVQLNSIFSEKTDPRENPEKNPGYYRRKPNQTTLFILDSYSISILNCSS
jgi:hypothetical protein